jgi:hypothetical protein
MTWNLQPTVLWDEPLKKKGISQIARAMAYIRHSVQDEIGRLYRSDSFTYQHFTTSSSFRDLTYVFKTFVDHFLKKQSVRLIYIITP